MASKQIYQVYADNPLTPALADIVPFQPNDGGATEMGAATWNELCIALGIPLTVKVTLSSAQILDLNTTPITLVAAPGSGKMIVPVAVSYRLNFNSSAYTTNLNLRLRMNGTLTQNSGILGLGATAYSMQPLAGGAYSTDITNTALTIDVATGNPAAGDSSLDVYITYCVITL